MERQRNGSMQSPFQPKRGAGCETCETRKQQPVRRTQLPQTCSICSSKQHAEIDAALLSDESLRNIAKRFGTSSAALFRHKNQGHIAATLAKAKQADEEVQAGDLFQRLKELNRETGSILAQAKTSRNLPLALQAIARVEKQIELEGKLLGQLNDGAPGGTTFQLVLMDAGREYPDEMPPPAASPRLSAPPRPNQPLAATVSITLDEGY
jgi:hypothetical protein